MNHFLKMRKQKGGSKRSDFTESRWQSSVGGISELCSREEATDALEQITNTDSASLATNVGATCTSFDIQWTLHREVGGDNATGVSLSLAQTHSTTISLEGTPTKYSMLRITSEPNWGNASRACVRLVVDLLNTTACVENNNDNEGLPPKVKLLF